MTEQNIHGPKDNAPPTIVNNAWCLACCALVDARLVRHGLCPACQSEQAAIDAANKNIREKDHDSSGEIVKELKRLRSVMDEIRKEIRGGIRLWRSGP